MVMRINVEMSTLSKVKAMQIDLNSQGVFNSMLKNNISKYLIKIDEELVCSKIEDFSKLIAAMVGFLLIRR
jgi:hypothetical protein